MFLQEKHHAVLFVCTFSTWNVVYAGFNQTSIAQMLNLFTLGAN